MLTSYLLEREVVYVIVLLLAKSDLLIANVNTNRDLRLVVLSKKGQTTASAAAYIENSLIKQSLLVFKA